MAQTPEKKRRRSADFLRANFLKLVWCFAGLGGFWMLKARLDKAPLPLPDNRLVAKAGVDESVLPNLFPPVESLDDGVTSQIEKIDDGLSQQSSEAENRFNPFEVSEDARSRFLNEEGPRLLNEERKLSAIEPKTISPVVKTRRQRVSKKREVVALRLPDELELPKGIERDWDQDSDIGALDDSSPLSMATNYAFEEAALFGVYDKERLQSLVQIDGWIGAKSVAISPIRTAIGVLRPQSFDSERKAVADLGKELDEIKLQPAPEPSEPTPQEIPGPLIDESQVVEAGPARALDSVPALDAQKELAQLAQSSPADLEPFEVKDVRRPSLQSAQLAAAEDTLKDFSQAEKGDALSHATDAISPPTQLAMQTLPVPPASHPTMEVASRELVKQENDENTHKEGPRGEKIIGSIELDSSATDWMDSKGGHIELYLHPVGSKDPQDTVFVETAMSDLSFEIDTARLKHRYRLVAGIYLSDSASAYATVTYPIEIHSNFRESIRFPIRRDQIDQQRRERPRQGSVPLNMTIFEALNGNYRKPQPISGARVQVLGLEEISELVAGGDGGVRISDVPIHSEIIVRVSAPGYLPTEQIVPVFGTAAYAQIYLLPNEKVADITQYFLHSPQQPSRGVLMGRVFDSKNRTPRANERLLLSFRKRGPLYFGALPDPSLKETTQQGLFGFFNLKPLFRVLTREEHLHGLLLNIREGLGYYVEWGRGGERPLKGIVQDPFNPGPLRAKISFLDRPEERVETDVANRFRFDRVDLPPGVLTVETEISGYARAWHTFSWSTRERSDPRMLHVLESDLVRESFKSFARPLQSGFGSIVGGASSAFMRNAICTSVRLLSADGASIDELSGPFYFSKKKTQKDPFCLTVREPGFSYVNLRPGEYLLQYRSPKGKTLRTRVVRVGMDRTSIAVE